MDLQQLLDRATGFHKVGHMPEAERLCLQILAAEPVNFTAHHLLGIIRAQQGRNTEALSLIGAALNTNPNSADALLNYGLVLQTMQRFEEAIASYNKALAIKPDFVQALNIRGVILSKLKQFEEALTSYDKALAIKPDYAEALNNRGTTLWDLKRLDEALASYDKALAIKPDYVAALNNHGNTLLQLNRAEEALASFEKTLAIKPDYAEALNNRGNALSELKRFERALASFDKALAIKPDYAEALNNRGTALLQLKRFEEALANYETALAIKPDYADLHYNQSLCLIALGRFEQGWRQYEWRKRLKEPFGFRPYPQPLWLGEENISGKTLFIYWEQGLGDTIQFCRYAKLCEARNAKVILSVQEPLNGLLQQISPTIHIIGPDEVPNDFDYHCPLLSMPLAFGTTLETIPAQQRYLKADKGLKDLWSARLSPKTKPRIGLAWSGKSEYDDDYKRSIELGQFLPLLSSDFDWICLQKEIKTKDLAVLNEIGRIAFYGENLRDFSDTAALLDLMDLVITVDTGVAHLAGAMGRPVRILLPYSPDYRWLLDRDDSPWYPSARLFRQQKIGNWAEVIDQVKSKLRHMNF